MADPDQMLVTQLRNLQTRAGMTLAQLYAVLKKSGLAKHGELRDFLKKELSMGHGDANTLVTVYLKAPDDPPSDAEGAASAATTPAAGTDAVAEIYSGKKAPLRSLHDSLMAVVGKFGDFEVAPKKAYVSLRRKKQFAMIGPATQTCVEVGLSAKSLAGGVRLVEQAPGGMCRYKVRVSSVAEIDAELAAWLRTSYDEAG